MRIKELFNKCVKHNDKQQVVKPKIDNDIVIKQPDNPDNPDNLNNVHNNTKTINEKLDSILIMAADVGCTYITRNHLKQHFAMYMDMIDRLPIEQLTKLLRELDLKIKFEWDARVYSYLSTPVQTNDNYLIL